MKNGQGLPHETGKPRHQNQPSAPARAQAEPNWRPKLQGSAINRRESGLSQPSELDPTTHSDRPSEWSVARLALAPAAENSTDAAANASRAAGAGAGASGYDPFAGAALVTRSGKMIDGYELDEAVLVAVRLEVKRANPGLRGSAIFRVRVAPSGEVVDAIAEAGTGSVLAQQLLRKALVGKALFRPSVRGGIGLVRLPPIDLA